MASITRRTESVQDVRKAAQCHDGQLCKAVADAMWSGRIRRVVSCRSDAVEVVARLVGSMRRLRTPLRSSTTFVTRRSTSQASLGRPRDHRRRVVLVFLACYLEQVGIRPTKSDTGIFASSTYRPSIIRRPCSSKPEEAISGLGVCRRRVQSRICLASMTGRIDSVRLIHSSIADQ